MANHQALSIILAGAAGSCKTSMALSIGQMFLWLGNSGAITDLAQKHLGFTPFCWPPTQMEAGTTADEKKKNMTAMLTIQGDRSDSQFYVDKWWWSLFEAVKEARWMPVINAQTGARTMSLPLINRMVAPVVYRVITDAEWLLMILDLLKDLDALSFIVPELKTRAFAGIGVDELSMLIRYELARKSLSKTQFVTDAGKKDTMAVFGEENSVATAILNLFDRGIGSGFPVLSTGHLFLPKPDKAIAGTRNRTPYADGERRAEEDKGGLELASAKQCAAAAKCAHALFIVLKNDYPINPDPWAPVGDNHMDVSLRVIPNDDLYHSKSRCGHTGPDMPPSIEAQMQPETLREMFPRYKYGKMDLSWEYDLAYEVRDALLKEPDFAEYANFGKRRAAVEKVANEVLPPWISKLLAQGHSEEIIQLWVRNAEQMGRAMADIMLRNKKKVASGGLKLFGGAQRPTT